MLNLKNKFIFKSLLRIQHFKLLMKHYSLSLEHFYILKKKILCRMPRGKYFLFLFKTFQFPCTIYYSSFKYHRLFFLKLKNLESKVSNSINECYCFFLYHWIFSYANLLLKGRNYIQEKKNIMEECVLLVEFSKYYLNYKTE